MRKNKVAPKIKTKQNKTKKLPKGRGGRGAKEKKNKKREEVSAQVSIPLLQAQWDGGVVVLTLRAPSIQLPLSTQG